MPNNVKWKIAAFNELEHRAEELREELRVLDASFRWYQFWRVADRHRRAELKETLSCVRFVMFVVGRDLARQQEAETDE